jgi:hypothetical protein
MRDYRLRMLRRAERWRRKISMLSLAIVGASPRARVAFSREFNGLVSDCERVVRAIESLATAVDSHSWSETRAQAEREWADLVARTGRLQWRVHRHLASPAPAASAERLHPRRVTSVGKGR